MVDWFDKIEDYLENRLSAAEKTGFDKALKSDPELAAELEWARLELQATEVLIEKKLRQKTRDWERERLQNLPKNREFRWFKHPVFWLGLGLSAALVWWLSRPAQESPALPQSIENQPIATELPPQKPTAPPATTEKKLPEKTPASQPPRPRPTQAQQYIAAAESRYQMPMLSPVRGDAIAEHPFNQALRHFQNNEFEAAAALLAATEKSWFESGVFLRGHANFRARKFEQAAADFRLLTERNSLIYGTEARWHLALCYLALQPRFKRELQETLANARKEASPAEADKYAELEKLLR